MNCVVPQVLLCKRFPSPFYSPPTSHLCNISLASSVLLFFCHHSSIHCLPSRNSLKSLIRCESLCPKWCLSLFKCLHYFSGVLVRIKSSMLNLPSLFRHSSALLTDTVPTSLFEILALLCAFLILVGSFKLGQDQGGGGGEKGSGSQNDLLYLVEGS